MYETIFHSAEDLYSHYESNCRSKVNRVCIDGRVTGCGKCVGYCQYSGHPGFLTKDLRKQHDCLNRNCYHYVPKPPKEKPQVTCNKLSAYLNEIGCARLPYEGMKVLDVNESDEGLLLRYITITNGYSLEELSGMLADKLGCNIFWEKLDYNFDVCAQLLFA